MLNFKKAQILNKILQEKTYETCYIPGQLNDENRVRKRRLAEWRKDGENQIGKHRVVIWAWVEWVEGSSFSKFIRWVIGNKNWNLTIRFSCFIYLGSTNKLRLLRIIKNVCCKYLYEQSFWKCYKKKIPYELVDYIHFFKLCINSSKNNFQLWEQQ